MNVTCDSYHHELHSRGDQQKDKRVFAQVKGSSKKIKSSIVFKLNFMVRQKALLRSLLVNLNSHLLKLEVAGWQRQEVEGG